MKSESVEESEDGSIYNLNGQRVGDDYKGIAIKDGKKVYIIDNGYALICLENKLDVSIADELLKLKEELMVDYSQVILKDEALDDNSSINIYETLKSNGVEFYTI